MLRLFTKQSSVGYKEQKSETMIHSSENIAKAAEPDAAASRVFITVQHIFFEAALTQAVRGSSPLESFLLCCVP